MAKGMYIGVDSVARKVKNCYIGVDGVARKVKKAYIGVDGIARLFWQSNPIGSICYLGIRNGNLCVVVSDGYESDVNVYTVPNSVINTKNYNTYGIKKIFDTYYISCRRYNQTTSNELYMLYTTKDFVTYKTLGNSPSTVYEYSWVTQVGNNVVHFSPYSSMYISTDKGETFNPYDSYYYFTKDHCSDGTYLYTRVYSDDSIYLGFQKIDLVNKTNSVMLSGTNTNTYGAVSCCCADSNMVLFFTAKGYVFKFTNQGTTSNAAKVSVFSSTDYPTNAVCYNNMYYVITSTNKVYSSSDGINWTLKLDAYKDSTTYRNILVVNNVLHVLVGVSPTDYSVTDDKTYIYHSTNGSTFESCETNELITSIAPV